MLELWEGCRVELDLKELVSKAIPVKGCMAADPARFAEIFANDVSTPQGLPDERDERSWEEFARSFYPQIPGVRFSIGPEYPQPPYCWKDVDPSDICRSFTYNTNALHRVLLNLIDRGSVAPDDLPRRLDRACQVLAYVYKARGSYLLKHINNNINMYFISKTLEFVLGKDAFDCECQELELTTAALEIALRLSLGTTRLSTREKMGLAIGRGVSFVEERMCRKDVDGSLVDRVDVDAFAYFHQELAIDHRERFLATIENVGVKKGRFSLVVVVDDATETIADFLWLADILQLFPFLEISLLVNTAQISINFSAHMIRRVFEDPAIGVLAGRFGSRFRLVRTYCPFISFQTSALTPEAQKLIGDADAVFVKGANFFETLQIADKDTFYAFVVFGPVSRACTGLNDFDAVWAHVPVGEVGYRFDKRRDATRTLLKTVGKP